MSLCKQIGISVERRDEILDEMRSDDYEHLIQTFDKYFGMIIDLERWYVCYKLLQLKYCILAKYFLIYSVIKGVKKIWNKLE